MARQNALKRFQSKDDVVNRIQDQLLALVNPLLRAVRLEYLAAAPDNATPPDADGTGGDFAPATLTAAIAQPPTAAVVVPIPTSSASVGERGMVCADGSYLYVCVNTNTWRRVALATW